MTRRHEALIPLTHDHHHALRHARMLRRGADGDDAERLSAARAFVAFFQDHSVQHFREEEEEIFPVVVNTTNAPIAGISRILIEHVQLHSMHKELSRQIASGAVSPEAMRNAADLLKRHVRFEEDELFPAIEQLVATELQGVRLGERRRNP